MLINFNDIIELKIITICISLVIYIYIYIYIYIKNNKIILI